MMIENIENEKDCCGSCDFCMFDNNGNAVCADDNSKHKYVILFLRMMKYVKIISYDLA